MLWNKFNLFTFNIICNIILSITKKTARIWKFGIVEDGSSSAHNCQCPAHNGQFVLVLCFIIVLMPYHEHEPRGHGFFRVWPQHELLLSLEVGPRGPAPGEGAVASLQSEEDEATASGLHIPVDYCAAVVHQLGEGKWVRHANLWLLTVTLGTI